MPVGQSMRRRAKPLRTGSSNLLLGSTVGVPEPQLFLGTKPTRSLSRKLKGNYTVYFQGCKDNMCNLHHYSALQCKAVHALGKWMLQCGRLWKVVEVCGKR